VKPEEIANTEPPSATRSATDAFGRLLREQRLRAGFSQEHLAERAGMSVTGVSALERGIRRAPQRATVDLLANALGLGHAERAQLEQTAARARGRAGQGKELPARHLPKALSSLVGRDDDIPNIEGLLGRFRLVTITGSGGVGKTRVALEVGSRRSKARGEEVHFVDLAPVADGTFVAAKIAASVQPAVTDSSIAAVAAALAGRPMLLILDTCEHVIADAAFAARTILECCPEVTVLATSRERFQLAGEALYRLPSLPPDSAANLFVQRAGEADPGAVFTHEGLGQVLDVCRRLEGIPLAIELAAARLSTLGIETLLARLDEHMALAGGRRDLPQRQYTMLATIGWSYELLDGPERELLRCLAVFSGGFTLDAAERVCRDRPGGATVGVLSSLVDKSLVDVVRNADSVRYRLLDSVRAFALRELRGAGEDERAFRCHAAWVAEIADHFEADAVRMTHAEFAELLPEFDNVRAAIAWSLEAPAGDDRALAAHIIFGLRGLWHMTGQLAEQRRWIDMGLERIDEGSHPREVGQLLRAFILRSWNEATVVPMIERAIDLFERVGDGRATAALHSTLTFIFGTLGRFAEAEQSADRAATLMTSEGMRDTLVYAAFLSNRAGLRTDQGRLDEARADLADAADIASGKDRYFVVSRCLPRLATIEWHLGNIRRAIEICEEMLASEYGDTPEVVISALEALVTLRLALGEFDEAAVAARSLLERTQRDTAPWCHVAAIVALRGHAEVAARLAGFIDALYAQSLLPRNRLEQGSYEILRTELRRQLTSEVIDLRGREGARFTVQEAGGESLRALALTQDS